MWPRSLCRKTTPASVAGNSDHGVENPTPRSAANPRATRPLLAGDRDRARKVRVPRSYVTPFCLLCRVNSPLAMFDGTCHVPLHSADVDGHALGNVLELQTLKDPQYQSHAALGWELFQGLLADRPSFVRDPRDFGRRRGRIGFRRQGGASCIAIVPLAQTIYC